MARHKFKVTFLNCSGVEQSVTVRADDEAAALGTVLDEHAEDIPNEPCGFMVGPDEPLPVEAIPLPTGKREVQALFKRLEAQL